jgi:hypothetical protein
MRAAALALLAATALACQPMGPIPGGRLKGEVVTTPVDDWSFASAVETIQLESNPADPYSVNVWFVAQGARLWIAAGSGDKSRWAKDLLADPRVRLRIEGKIYERKAVRVTEQSEMDEVLVLYQTKYDYERDADEEGEALLFRMDPR